MTDERIPVKCDRCGFDGHVPLGFGHVCMKMITLDEYARLQGLRNVAIEEAAKVCERQPIEHRIQPADRRSRMANLCASAIRKLKEST